MRRHLLRMFKSSKDIKDFYVRNVAPLSSKDRRSAVSVCVIDDQPFVPLSNLTNVGYSIKPIGDIKSVDEVRDYDLILCDIMGVGLHFDDKLQGASIISEIKSNHPEKIVIAYTAAALNVSAAKQAKSMANFVIKKDDDIDKWKIILDSCVSTILNPYDAWERIRIDLVRNKVDTVFIVLLEDSYVRSILSRDSTFSKVVETMNSSGLSSDARSMINGLLSSAAFRLIVGA